MLDVLDFVETQVEIGQLGQLVEAANVADQIVVEVKVL